MGIFNAANLIKLEDVSDKEIKGIEIAANNNQLDKTKSLKFTSRSFDLKPYKCQQ